MKSSRSLRLPKIAAVGTVCVCLQGALVGAVSSVEAAPPIPGHGLAADFEGKHLACEGSLAPWLWEKPEEKEPEEKEKESEGKEKDEVDEKDSESEKDKRKESDEELDDEDSDSEDSDNEESGEEADDDDDDDEDAEDEPEADDEDDKEEEDDDSDSEEVLPLTIETLTSIDWRKGDELPEEITKYDGKLVKISGYMATGTELDASEFELVPQNCECGKSKVNHFVKVIIEDGGAEFDPARVQFTGRLEIGEEEEDGFVTSLYRLTIESFDPEEPDADTALRGPWRHALTGD